MKTIKDKLLSLKDEKYKKFQCSLMPTVEKEKVIGVRTPQLKRLCNDVWKRGEGEKFLLTLPHEFYEENNLHAFLIMKIKDFQSCVLEVERFLPFIDNWATCDALRPPCFKNNISLLPYIDHWIASDHVYTVRFAIEMLMLHFSGDNFKLEFLEKVGKIKSDEYYINMMIAWYFATLLCFRFDETYEYLCKGELSPWVHNKTIQKATESFKISDERKKILRSIRKVEK